MPRLTELEGTWYIATTVADGEPMDGDAIVDAHIVVSGPRFVSNGMGLPYEGTVTLSPRKQPKTIDLSITSGHAAGTVHRGIYKIASGTLTLCLGAAGGDRPARFSARAGSGNTIQTLQRQPVAHPSAAKRATPVSKSAAAFVPPESSAPATVIEGDWAMVAAVMNGAPLAESMVAWCTRVTRGDRTQVLAAGKPMLDARFTLDDPVSPRQIDYVIQAGPNKGKRQQGIVELVGDSLRICVAAPGKSRPREFASAPGDGRSFTSWRRAGAP